MVWDKTDLFFHKSLLLGVFYIFRPESLFKEKLNETGSHTPFAIPLTILPLITLSFRKTLSIAVLIMGSPLVKISEIFCPNPCGGSSKGPECEWVKCKMV